MWYDTGLGLAYCTQCDNLSLGPSRLLKWYAHTSELYGSFVIEL